MQYYCILNGGHLEKWAPSWIFIWPDGEIKRATPNEYVYQFWCLYPQVNDSPIYLQLSAPLFESLGDPLVHTENDVFHFLYYTCDEMAFSL